MIKFSRIIYKKFYKNFSNDSFKNNILIISLGYKIDIYTKDLSKFL